MVIRQEAAREGGRSTLCVGFSLRRRTAGGRTEREGEKDRERKLRGGVAATEEQ